MRKYGKRQILKKFALNLQLLTIQILVSDVQLLILCLSYSITTVHGWQFRLDLDSLLFLEKKYAKLCNVYKVDRLEHCLNQQC